MTNDTTTSEQDPSVLEETPPAPEEQLTPAEEEALKQEQVGLDQAIQQSQMAYLTNRLSQLARENALLKKRLEDAEAQPSL